ncbi:DUF6716 putative glycosyltransferase [Methylopila sp. M107]|uniref:DUF6716 putative glycosyltransferase n=1 Tax=Methylopila sp. M107 TaxID=1101190 RepID=UPI00036285D9|nr:DUF6716 putative glycosyltransferase [Methylopila sp. M107]
MVSERKDAGPEAGKTKAGGRFAGRQVLALGTFDSFLRTAVVIGRMFEQQGATLKIAALAAAGQKAQLSDRQLKAGGIHENVPMVSAETLVKSRLFRDSAVVIAVIDGGRARELFLSLNASDLAREKSRPILAIASPGLALAEHLAGYMSRAPADILCFNAPGERAQYVEAAGEIGVDPSNAIVTGLLGLDRRPRAPSAAARPSIVFFEQPVIPPRRMQRNHLLAGLTDVARGRPDVDVLIKLRHAKGETVHHEARFHFEDIARKLFSRGGQPANLRFTHEPAPELLERASLAVTVSSTVAVEAMARGVPTRIVSDFGISEALGTAYFVGSGCFAPLSGLSPDMPDVTRRTWLDERSGASTDPEALLGRCAELIGRQDELGAALPMRSLAPAYGSAGFVAYALGIGGPVAVHAPHLLDKPMRGVTFIGSVAARLRQARVIRQRRKP